MVLSGRVTGRASRPCGLGTGGDLSTSVSIESSSAIGTAPVADRAGLLRAAMLIAGAAGAGLLSTWSWLFGRVDGKFVLDDRGVTLAVLPNLLVFGAVGGVMLGCVGILWALLKDTRLRGFISFCFNWFRNRTALGCLVGLVAAFGAVDLYEVLIDAEAIRWNRDAEQNLRAYMVREDLRAWLLFGATVMAALAMNAAFPPGPACPARAARMNGIFDRPSKKIHYVIAFAAPVILGSALCVFSLDGLPHFSDSLTYLMQARMLENGQLAMDKPAHPDLWIGSMFFVTDGQKLTEAGMAYEGTRMFGKYPIGWPAVLAVFDKFHVGFLANAVMSGLVAVMTGMLASQFTSKRIAVIAALLYGLSPWAWFNGAHFASHVASTVAVTGFLWMYLRAYRLNRTEGSTLPWGSALGAGLFLGAAVLVRPFDAAMFALPAVVLTVGLLIRQPKSWLPLGVLIAVGAMVGVGIYFGTNIATTGVLSKSPYSLEGRWNADWEPSIKSIVHRVQFQWAELNARFPGYGFGGMTAAVLGLIIAVRTRVLDRVGLGLTIACASLFVVVASIFLFTNVWWGPRWLLPVTPVIAILGGVLIDAVIRATQGEGSCAVDANQSNAQPAGAKPADRTRPAAQMALSIFLAGICVSLAVAWPGQAYLHRTDPPHNVSGEAMRHIEAQGLQNAVVAMPQVGERAPLDARAGMVFMRMPFEANDVIIVRNVDGWREKARECFPNRQLYELIADTESVDGFKVTPANEAGDVADDNPDASDQ